MPMAILPSLQQLRFLCAVAKQCHFGRAAESCAVTQSTLSEGIKELEARLGIALFERSHRRVMLTPFGGRDRDAIVARRCCSWSETSTDCLSVDWPEKTSARSRAEVSF
ncbi:LysR family transcriptional regulator [Bradyrhizobium sp. Bra64]|uniref:LysR family transcriptional regulator n=1 Tax=Bradyrhizobium sp. Bra64 TaxID=2926009 RepID=UPI002741DC16|nr:LysR family transcriptional regulator [Bradyrhizobium sp. Bra64]